MIASIVWDVDPILFSTGLGLAIVRNAILFHG